MIRPRVGRCDPIIPTRQASSYIDRQHSIHRGGVYYFEKHKFLRIQWRGLTEPCQLLNNDMGMPENVPVRVDSGRVRHVSLRRVREPTSLEVIDCELHGKRLALRQRSKVRREDELCRGHVIRAWNDAYRSGVTRSTYRFETRDQPSVPRR